MTYQNDENEKEFNLMREEIYRELYLAVRDLPDCCREVFELHVLGKENEEIAELLSLSVESVVSCKKYTVLFFKERLGDLFIWLVLMKVI